MERVGIGIVGAAGNIAPLNVAGYLEHPACEVVALCDPAVDKARARAEDWGLGGRARVHAGLDDLLADPAVDAVEILSPTHLHHDHVLAAIDAGKHVSCQKPLANRVDEVLAMGAAARAAGVVLRTSECFRHYPPLETARALVDAGAIGTPTVLRIKTVVGTTDTAFQAGLDVDGYWWRFDQRSPGGHLFDDMVHKYACARWLVDSPIVGVQSVVRSDGFFFEAPTVALFEYEREDLLGMMEVSYAPRMHVRSRYYGADEFFEIQGTDGWIWVTRATGEMLDLAPVIVQRADGSREEFVDLDADWATGFRRSSAHFVDALLEGRPDPVMTAEESAEVLQLCFAVYQASMDRAVVDPRTITGSVSPPGWPPMRS